MRDERVLFKVSSIMEALVAYVAFKWLLASVYQLMCLAIATEAERLVAIRAVEWLFSCVNSHMLNQI